MINDTAFNIKNNIASYTMNKKMASNMNKEILVVFT